MKSCHKPVVDFKSNSKSVKSYKRFYSKKYQNDNQQKRIDYLKLRSNKNEHECKKCGCNFFYVPGHEQVLWLEIERLSSLW